jgi:hypothetical protein
MASVREVILGAPEAAVDVQQNGMRPFRARQPHFEEVVGVRTVENASIGWRLWFTENIFVRHEVAPTLIWLFSFL